MNIIVEEYTQINKKSKTFKYKNKNLKLRFIKIHIY